MILALKLAYLYGSQKRVEKSVVECYQVNVNTIAKIIY